MRRAILQWMAPAMAGLLFSTTALTAAEAKEIVILRSDEQSMVFEYRPQFLPPATFTSEHQEFHVYDFRGSVPTYNRNTVGGPDIRYASYSLGFPAETGNSIQVIAADYEDVPDVLLAPVPSFRMKDDMLEVSGHAISGTIYNENRFLPLAAAELASVGKSRSLFLGSVRLYPVRYNPAARTVRKYTRMVIEVVYGAPQGRRVQNSDDLLFKEILLNYPVARAWKFGSELALAKAPAPSVLASGDWYRLAVVDEGVYVLSAQTLAGAGISIGSLDPRTIKIYGNGGREVPEDITTPRPPDLVENALYVAGEQDGKFDAGDYVLFYGKSVRGWVYDAAAKALRHYINRYSDVNYYWFTFGGAQGKRMQVQPSQASDPTVVPDRFQDAVAVEEEKQNLLGSGKDWYGQLISVGSSFTHVNPLPGLVANDVVRYRYSLLARSDQTPVYTVREGGDIIGASQVLQTVDYGSVFSNYASEGTFQATHSSSTLVGNMSQLNFALASSSASAQGWINWVEIQYPRYFSGINNYLRFRSPDVSGIVEYRLEQFTAVPFILNVTDPAAVQLISGVVGSYTFRASENAGRISEYCAAAPGSFKTPVAIAALNRNENPGDLHAPAAGADFLIITSPEFRAAADRLKAFREQPAHGNLKTRVLEVNQIYNEFGCGIPDVTAIRDFLKYAYDNWQPRPFYVLLFGQASYDYKGILGSRSSYVPTWQSAESRNDIDSYATDDFFAKFGTGDFVSLATGRISSRQPSEANTVVDKLIRYEESSARDNWKTRMLFIGDDGWTTEGGESDGTQHSDAAETLAEGFYGPRQRYTPDEFERKKIYIAEYPTVNTAQGRRKPGAYQAIIDQVNQGVLVVNYTGHGNPAVWAHERILDVRTSIPQMVNANKLSLFFAATCDFSAFDNPTEYTGSELLLNKPDGGAIGAVSASRKVFASNNAFLHREVFKRLFNQNPYGKTVITRPAEALYLMKASVSNNGNDQKYLYMGDPTMRLQYPSGFASIDSINHQPVDSVNGIPRTEAVQLKALSRVTVSGTVRDQSNQPDNSFNGTANLSINDASRQVVIVDFSPSVNWPYTAPGGTIYRGQISTVNGKFSATFVVPKDISYGDLTARGRLEAYIFNATADAIGYTNNVNIGGTDSTRTSDIGGPKINLYLDSRSFRTGDMVSASPMLYVDLRDSNGINTSSSGIGHRIEAWVNNSTQSRDITDYYSSTLDNFQEGTVQYQLNGLTPGRNTIRVRAWDTFNNAATAETFFEVTSTDQLKISDVMNYPNPFSSGTTFTFKQNQGGMITVGLKIYSVAGRLIQSLQGSYSGEPFIRVPWDGRDRDGDILANGVYLYKLIVKTADGRFSSEALGKLAVLK